MNRRELLKVPGMIGAAAVAAAWIPSSRRYGHVTVESHLIHYRRTGEFLHVHLDGVDVTVICAEADDIAGVVRLIPRDDADYRFWEKRGVIVGASEIKVRGLVLIAPGAPLR
jgi:hypothetical protein